MDRRGMTEGPPVRFQACRACWERAERSRYLRPPENQLGVGKLCAACRERLEEAKRNAGYLGLG
jgi:hypothetical protein